MKYICTTDTVLMLKCVGVDWSRAVTTVTREDAQSPWRMNRVKIKGQLDGILFLSLEINNATRHTRPAAYNKAQILQRLMCVCRTEFILKY